MAEQQRIRVRNVYPFSPDDQRMLDAISPRLEIVHEGEDSPEWSAALDDPDLEVLSASFPPEDLQRTPALRWLAQAGAGADHLTGADPRLTITNGSGASAVAMAEYILAAALSWIEQWPERIANQVARGWDGHRYELAGRGLRGRTAVILGYGGIGREAARLLSACGVDVIAVKARPDQRTDDAWHEPGTGDPDGTIPSRFAGIDELPAVVAEADLLVVTLPLTQRTKGLVSAAVLGAATRPLCVINVGRGAVIDEDALLAALTHGHVDAAYLDVTAREPLPPTSPLWDHDRVIVTPHVSGIGDPDVTWHNAAMVLADNLARYVEGRPLINVVDLSRGY